MSTGRILSLTCVLFHAACTTGSGADTCGAAECIEGGSSEAGADASQGPDASGDTRLDASQYAVDVEDLLGSPVAGQEVVLVDARSAIAYEAGHAEGALSLDGALLRGTVDGVAGQLLPTTEVASAMGAAGISRDMALVVYGDSTDLTAARLFWSLEVLGHPFVALLDGGFNAWSSAGLPTESGPTAVEATGYPDDQAVPSRRVDAAYVLSHLDDPAVVLVDARSAAEYEASHIPGAQNFDWQDNVVDGQLKPLTELQALYAALPTDGTLVSYCQTGSRASMAYFVLRQLGYPDVRLYDGSMAEWGADPALPQE